MGRSLFLQFIQAGEKMKSEEDLFSAVVPLLKLLSLTLIGVVLAHPKTQLVPKATFKLLSKLVFALLLPCLIFTHLGQSITLRNFIHWWFIPVNLLISTSIGCLLGFMVAVICRPPEEYFRFTIIMTGFGNTGNLPLAIVSSFCHGKDNLFGENCHSNGLAYVSFAQWLAVILVYTLVYHMMEPPKGYAQFVEEADESKEMEEMDEDGDLSRPLLQEVESPGMEDQDTEHSDTPFLANMFNSASNVSENRVTDVEAVREDEGKSPRPVRCLEEPRMVSKIRSVAEQMPIKNILQPPTVASMLAIVIGVVPQLKAFVFGDDTPLSFIADSLEILAGAVVPLVMLILGGMLAEGPSKSKLGLRTTIGIIAARLLVLPLSGIGVVLLADKLNLLVQGDDMYRFVLLLQYTTPSAILLGAIASLRGYAVREASALVFWQHIFAVISISVYIVIYFRFLPTYS